MEYSFYYITKYSVKQGRLPIYGTSYQINIVFLKDYSQDSGSYNFLHSDYLRSIPSMSDHSGDLLEESHFDTRGNLTHGSIDILERGYTSHEHFILANIIQE